MVMKKRMCLHKYVSLSYTLCVCVCGVCKCGFHSHYRYPNMYVLTVCKLKALHLHQ